MSSTRSISAGNNASQKPDFDAKDMLKHIGSWMEGDCDSRDGFCNGQDRSTFSGLTVIQSAYKTAALLLENLALPRDLRTGGCSCHSSICPQYWERWVDVRSMSSSCIRSCNVESSVSARHDVQSSPNHNERKSSANFQSRRAAQDRSGSIPLKKTREKTSIRRRSTSSLHLQATGRLLAMLLSLSCSRSGRRSLAGLLSNKRVLHPRPR